MRYSLPLYSCLPRNKAYVELFLKGNFLILCFDDPTDGAGEDCSTVTDLTCTDQKVEVGITHS